MAITFAECASYKADHTIDRPAWRSQNHPHMHRARRQDNTARTLKQMEMTETSLRENAKIVITEHGTDRRRRPAPRQVHRDECTHIQRTA